MKTRLQLEARHKQRTASTLTPTTTLPQSTTLASSSSPSQIFKQHYSTAVKPDSAVKDKMLPALRMTLNIVKKEGVPGLYRGMSASYLGVTEGVIQWVLYEVRLDQILPFPDGLDIIIHPDQATREG